MRVEVVRRWTGENEDETNLVVPVYCSNALNERDFGELQGMLSTFGSTEVVKACLIYQKADRTAYDRLARWCRAICALADARRRGSGQSVSETEAESQAKKAFSAAVDAALATGGALQKAIHDDLDKESRWHSA